MTGYTAFMLATLVPAARDVLLPAFEAHGRGEDIGIDRKAASGAADKAAKPLQRRLTSA